MRRTGQFKQVLEMQELTNDNYSDIKLHSICHTGIEYKTIGFITYKKRTNNYIPDPPLAGAASKHLAINYYAELPS